MEEHSQPRDHADVPVITPADFPPPMEFTVLPIKMELTNGVIVKKMVRPVVLNWGPQDNYFSRLMLFQVVNILNVIFGFWIIQLKSSVLPQAWNTNMDLDRLRDPEVASEEANQEDVAGRHGETRIDAVWRKLRGQFVVS